MTSHSLIVAKEEDPFSFLPQLPSLDFGENGFASMDWDCEMDIQECYFDAFPLIGSVPDTFYSSQDIVPAPKMSQGEMFCASDNGTGAGIWSELGLLLIEPAQAQAQAQAPLMLCKNEETLQEPKKQRKVTRRYRLEEKIKRSKLLSRETISQYFYMPITKAAKELNVGLTLLKKRCRELDIRRWPHRKLMSLQTLMKNVQELQREGDGSIEERLKEAIEILERERKLIEERPDLQMEDQTKRLRQACFKANYKKRKLMGMMGPMMSTSSSDSHEVLNSSNTIPYDEYQTGNEDFEEMGSLFSCSSSNNNML